MTSVTNCADFVMIASYDVHIYLNLFDTYTFVMLEKSNLYEQ